MMKKLLLIALAQLISVLALAQNIVGTWKHAEDDGAYSFTEVDTFKSDGKLEGTADVKFLFGKTKDGQEVSMKFSLKYDGTWECKDNLLKQKFNVDNIKVVSSECSEKFPKWIFKIVMNSGIKEFKKEAAKGTVDKIESFSDTEMILIDQNEKEQETAKFIRVSK